MTDDQLVAALVPVSEAAPAHPTASNNNVQRTISLHYARNPPAGAKCFATPWRR